MQTQKNTAYSDHPVQSAHTLIYAFDILINFCSHILFVCFAFKAVHMGWEPLSYHQLAFLPSLSRFVSLLQFCDVSPPSISISLDIPSSSSSASTGPIEDSSSRVTQSVTLVQCCPSSVRSSSDLRQRVSGMNKSSFSLQRFDFQLKV